MIMAEIFGLVIVTSLYASVVGLVIVLFKAILKDKINAFWHCFIWVVLILKLLIPFGPESAVSLFNGVPVQDAQSKVAGIASQAKQEYVRTGMSGQPVPDAPSKTAVQIAKIGVSFKGLLPYIWAFVAGLMLLFLLFTNYSLHRKLCSSFRADERIKCIFKNCKKKMNVKTNIEIILQGIIATPSLFGIIRPKILLTPAVSNLSDKELEYILLHELAHYKRKDVFVNYLLLVFQTLHWFNPVMWYCFKRLRQDMEAATDEKVLGILENTEYKEYGRALLAVLEGFNANQLAPRLLGMVDDKKNIERRIKMIKMAEFYKNKKRLVMAIGIICVVILCGVLLTNGKNANTKDRLTDINSIMLAGYDAGALLKYKSPYIGDASNVSNLLNTLPLGEYKKRISLDTEKEPYGLTADYDITQFKDSGTDITEKGFLLNSVILFSLIDNLDIILYNVRDGSRSDNYSYTRSVLQIYFDRDLRDYSKDKKDFEKLLSYCTTNNWKSSAVSNYLKSAGVNPNNIKQIRIEYFENDNMKIVQTVDGNLITKLINDMNNLELLPLSKMSATRNFSNGVYMVLNTGEKDNYFYIHNTTGGISRHMPTMSSLPLYSYRFENTEKLKSVFDSFISSVNSKTSGALTSKTIDQAVSNR
jgi:bla regulator protein BlaR1